MKYKVSQSVCFDAPTIIGLLFVISVAGLGGIPSKE
jgi:hypothetical protein